MDGIEANSNGVVSGETEALREKVPYTQLHRGRARKGGANHLDGLNSTPTANPFLPVPPKGS